LPQKLVVSISLAAVSVTRARTGVSQRTWRWIWEFSSFWLRFATAVRREREQLPEFRYDQETQVRRISVVRTKEKSENWKTPEFGNL
jgi:hypothetical protein